MVHEDHQIELMEMIGHLYKITRESTGEYYYGIHRGDRFDGYWGSGRIIKSYGKTDKTIRDRIKSPNPRFDGWSFIKTPDPDYTIISTADIRGIHR